VTRMRIELRKAASTSDGDGQSPDP